MIFADYEAVIGLEVHAELKTKSKIFCSCATAFGATPNSQCCPICMGLPGAMPSLNRRAVELAIKAGLLLHCEIARHSRIDRKQYFYPDLPKAYQISQDTHPLCKNGYLDLTCASETLRVGIERIHIEEDAGKLIHGAEATLVDYNRCGIGLIEIVSKPDLRTGEQAAAYLRTLREVLLAADISDGKMQEGSLRCDVNLSVRKRGESVFGVRTEIKNLNSFSFVQKAIEYEFGRQCEILLSGGEVERETRRFDEQTGKTYSMRTKESAADYRFLIEPDLLSIAVDERELERIRGELPEMPAERAQRLMQRFSIRESDAKILVSDRWLADYFEATVAHTNAPLSALNLILGELLRMSEGECFSSPILPRRVGELADLLDTGIINSSTAKKLLSRLVTGDFDPREIVDREDLAQIRDEAVLREVIVRVLDENPRAVRDYLGGKTNAIRALQGRAMAQTGGRADPVLLEMLLPKMLNGSDVNAKGENGNV